MNLNLPYITEEYRSLVALMRDFCEREVDRKELDNLADKPIPPNATKKDVMERIPWDLISKAHDAGLRQLCVPKEYGGGGYGKKWVAQTAIAEAAGYYGGQVGRLFTIPWKHCSTICYAPKSVQDEFFPAFMKNRKTMFAASITEPDHGSDLLIPYDEPGYSGKCFAHKDGDDWVINGEKMWCTAGGCSDYIIVTVRTDKEGPASKSMTTFLVPTETAGWSVAHVNDMMGNEITANTQMFFDNVRIPDKLRISGVNGAMVAMKSRLAGKTVHYMTLLGETRRVWEEMRDYTKTRIQGGKPIIEHPNVGMLVAEADVMIRNARLLDYQFAWECDQFEESEGTGLVDPMGWWYFNYYYKETVMRMVNIGLEVYGGMGPQKELSFERWVRLNLSLIHGGSTGLLNLVKASKAL